MRKLVKNLVIIVCLLCVVICGVDVSAASVKSRAKALDKRFTKIVYDYNKKQNAIKVDYEYEYDEGIHGYYFEFITKKISTKDMKFTRKYFNKYYRGYKKTLKKTSKDYYDAARKSWKIKNSVVIVRLVSKNRDMIFEYTNGKKTWEMP